jgi:hypothetical protein
VIVLKGGLPDIEHLGDEICRATEHGGTWRIESLENVMFS